MCYWNSRMFTSKKKRETNSAHFNNRCKMNVEHTTKVGDIERITDQSLEWKPNVQVF